MFDIESENYEVEVMNWLKNLKTDHIEIEYPEMQITSNVDFPGLRFILGLDSKGKDVCKINYKDIEVCFYPESIEVADNHDITAIKVDDMMWAYDEHRTCLKSFGMDMTMPFLQEMFD